MTTASASKSNVRFIAKVAILGAIAFVLMMFDFPIPFVAPSFYKMDLSELPVLIGGFAMGPGAAVAIEALKIILNLLYAGSATMFVGETANFLIGCAFCVPAAVIYKNEKTKKGAVKGLVCGTLSMALIGVLLNYAVLLPAYGYFFHMPIEAIVSMGAAIFPFVKGKMSFVIACVTPFNLIKGVVVSLVTMLLYKRVSPLLKK